MVETAAAVIKEMVEAAAPVAVMFREMQCPVRSQRLGNHMYGEQLDQMLLTVQD